MQDIARAASNNQAEARYRSLREPAADLGVSHEMIRTVLRQQRPTLAELR